jgi:hypothetical protein
MFAVNSSTYMDIVKNGFNAIKTLTVTDFLKVNSVNC